MANYSIRRHLSCDYDEALARTRLALADNGFGILTEIDVKPTLKKKLDVDFRRYIILGACSPPHANRALNAELEIGLFLPCNVIVYEDDDTTGSVVSAVDPMVAMSMIENPELEDVAREVRQRLQAAVKAA